MAAPKLPPNAAGAPVEFRLTVCERRELERRLAVFVDALLAALDNAPPTPPAATDPVNRVTALVVAMVEMIAYGQDFMAQIVRNAQAQAAALDARPGLAPGFVWAYTPASH